eukprot:506525-Prymnesium_polylepis.1
MPSRPLKSPKACRPRTEEWQEVTLLAATYRCTALWLSSFLRARRDTAGGPLGRAAKAEGEAPAGWLSDMHYADPRPGRHTPLRNALDRLACSCIGASSFH